MIRLKRKKKLFSQSANQPLSNLIVFFVVTDATAVAVNVDFVVAAVADVTANAVVVDDTVNLGFIVVTRYL